MPDPADSSRPGGETGEPSPTEHAAGSLESHEDKRAPETDQTAHVSGVSLARAHEVQEVNVRAILRFAVGLLVVLVVAQLVLWWVLTPTSGGFPVPQMELHPAKVTPVTVPGPGIEAQPALDRAAALAPAYERITSYGWLDEPNGIVYIPIDRAMELLVQRGLPASQNREPPDFALPPAYRLDSRGGQVTFATPNAQK